MSRTWVGVAIKRHTVVPSLRTSHCSLSLQTPGESCYSDAAGGSLLPTASVSAPRAALAYPPARPTPCRGILVQESFNEPAIERGRIQGRRPRRGTDADIERAL